MSAVAVSTGQQTRAELAGEVAQLYEQGVRHAEIGEALDLTAAQVHKILSGLFAEGMPKLDRRQMSDEQVRVIHAAYVRGGSIDTLAEAIGFKGSAARRRMRKLKLPLKGEKPQSKPARSLAHAEQRAITALLVARIDELREPRGLSLERLAGMSDVSVSSLQRMRSELPDPRLTSVLRLCRGLDVTPGELLDALPLPREARPRRQRRPARAGVET